MRQSPKAARLHLVHLIRTRKRN